MRGRLPVRAEVQVAPVARLRPQQRLRGRLHGLVPFPLVLFMPVIHNAICLQFSSVIITAHRKDHCYDTRCLRIGRKKLANEKTARIITMIFSVGRGYYETTCVRAFDFQVSAESPASKQPRIASDRGASSTGVTCSAAWIQNECVKIYCSRGKIE